MAQNSCILTYQLLRQFLCLIIEYFYLKLNALIKEFYKLFNKISKRT